jgi:hypothetical protein
MSWSKEFAEPISIPDGRTLVTLHDAASYITALSEKEADASEWQAAIEALILVVELGSPTMFARIGIMKALNRRHVREFNTSRKEHHWGHEKLKRDQP